MNDMVSYINQLLKGYVMAPIGNPVLYDGKPVGILLDPGHGYHTYMKPSDGKHSPDKSLYEGDWNREMVALLVPELRAIGFDARVLVPEDDKTQNQVRAQRANDIAAAEPDKYWIYLSIHINAAPKETCDADGWDDVASGFCAYCSRKGSKASRALAKTFVQLARMKDFGLAGNRSLPAEGYWQANYTVITESKMPAVLTESLFMTNRKEVEFLKSDEGKAIIVNLHIAALCKYFGVPYSLITGTK